MRTVIKKKNLEITPVLTDFIEKKLVKPVENRLKKLPSTELPLLELEIGRSTLHHHKGKVFHAEANLSMGGIFFRVEVDDDDLLKACDLMKDELLRDITKYKDKQHDTDKRGARKLKHSATFKP